ncbi:pentapeptide repeat-containing protein [Streptomyces triticagri]|uniref:Pentapeptide repeat-containing protein n=1 Tax=Streptomyces triticagri TaxID=2293568 RepID=A0A372LYG6_9ACTN|nr:pentapeptide repeat-containing protein [Streptomyces triticagri]RFU83599.1 pentapeptide repeat-containing protein [Streptomyces triticagri]
MGTDKRSRIDDGELRLWKVGRVLALAFLAAILGSAGVFWALVVILDVQHIESSTKLDAATLFDLVKLSFGVVAGAGALVALIVAYRRQRVDEAGAHREATRLHTERFSQAVDKLGAESAAVRLGGVHALAGLADDAPTQELRQTCIDVLCAYLRLPFAPAPPESARHHDAYRQFVALREVRHTIFRLIGDHFRIPAGEHRSWHGCDVDLTGVVVDANIDLSYVHFTYSKLSFKSAHFVGAVVNLTNARISDRGAVRFDEAVFNSTSSLFSVGLRVYDLGVLGLRDACFEESSYVMLKGAQFELFKGSFRSALFLGDVSFELAEFGHSFVDFHKVTFGPNGAATFEGASFKQCVVSFSEASGPKPRGLSAEYASSTMSLPDEWLTSDPGV